jgi:predicted permease
MGASRGRIAREFLAESLVLGILGGVTGLGLAYGGTKVLLSLASENLPRANEITVDPTVLLFTLGISVFAGLLFGVFPVLQYGRPNLVTSLKEGGRGGSAGKDKHRVRNLLAVSQVALASVLLIGSGLMIRSFQALRNVQPGFERPEEVLTFRVAIPAAEISTDMEAMRAHERIIQRLEQIPGVTSVGASSSVTMDGSDSNDAIFVEGVVYEEDQLPPIRRSKWIAGDYFETMENPILAGRSITWTDVHTLAPVAVMTENLAREFWGDPAAAIGKRIRQWHDAPWREVVGVVGNVRDDGVSQAATPVVYWPMAQDQFWSDSIRVARSLRYTIRTARPLPNSLLPEVRRAVWAVNPNLPIANVLTLDEILDRSMARTSFTLVMLGIAAAVAIILGAIGIYGVISYTVSQRTREIGVRMALGARQRDVSWLVLRQGGLVAAIGVAIGLAAAAGLTRLMSALLYGVSPADPITYSAAALGVAGVSLLASYLPARRAAGIDPNTALKWE